MHKFLDDPELEKLSTEYSQLITCLKECLTTEQLTVYVRCENVADRIRERIKEKTIKEICKSISLL